MGSGFSKLKKQAKQFEAQYEKMREDLKQQEVVGSAGGGLVTVTLTGDHALKRIEIKPACVDPNDVEGLQDLIKAAFDEANQKLEASSSGSPMGNLPFSL
jgi:DNA-binding YbaB/EbfC family protein